MSIASKSTFAISSGHVKSNGYRDVLQEVLNPADVLLNGARAWDIRVHNEGFYSKILAGGSLAFGETYMDGWWDCDALDELFDRLQQAMVRKKMKRPGKTIRAVLRAKM